MNDTTLTGAQKILLAARGLVADRFNPFTIEQLTVRAWKLDAHLFGLKGFADQHPNANVVYAVIMGERGLVRRGWLTRIGPKVYELSPQGTAEAERLASGNGHAKTLGSIQLAKDAEAELSRLLLTKAVLRLRANAGHMLNWTDAEAFWKGTSPDDVEVTIAEARLCLVGGVVRLRNGREVRERELDELGRVNAWLEKRFARELEKRKGAAHA